MDPKLREVVPEAVFIGGRYSNWNLQDKKNGH